MFDFPQRAISITPAKSTEPTMKPNPKRTAAIGVFKYTDILANSFPFFSATVRSYKNINIQASRVTIIGHENFPPINPYKSPGQARNLGEYL